MTSSHKVVEYAPNMSDYPQSPTIHPEVGPVNLIGRSTSGTHSPFSATSEIVFNKAPLTSVDPIADPEAFLADECRKKPLLVTKQAAAEAMGEIRQS